MEDPTKTDTPVATVETNGNVTEDTPSGDTIHPTIATAPEITSNTAGPGVTEVTDAMLAEYLKAQDPLVIELRTKLESLLNDLTFLQDDPWIQHAIDGLKKPDHEDRLEKQAEKTVTKTLLNEAYQNAKSGESITPPTKEAIAARVKKMMEDRRKKIQNAKDFKMAKAKAAILAGNQ